MPHPWSIHMKMTQIAKRMIFSVDAPFFKVSACRANTYSLKIIIKKYCFSHYTFCFKTQSGRISTHAVVSSSLWKCIEGRIPCFCFLLVSSKIMLMYKLHLSCCWQWWNLLYVSTMVISFEWRSWKYLLVYISKKSKNPLSSEVTGHIYLCFLPPAFK